MEDVGPRTVVATATTAENPTIPLITYNHTTLASNTYSSDQSRDPSLSSRPSLPWTPYSDSSIGLDKDSIDDHHSRFSHVHTPESSYGTRPPSVNEEALRYHRRRQGKFKIPEERFNPSDRYRRSHRGRRGRHAHSSHRQPQRKERRDSANTGCLRYTKYTETPADIVLDPQPSKITVVGDKLTKKTKNNGTTWRRIRQGLVLGKSKKKEQTEEQPPVEAEDVPKKKSKWKFWAKQPPVDDAEASDAPKTSDTDDEHAVMRRVSKGD